MVAHLKIPNLTQLNLMKLLSKMIGVLCAGAMNLNAQAEEAPQASQPKEALVEVDAVQIDGAKVGHWTMDFDAAKAIATEKKLPILMNFTGSDWCGWCKLMDKNVFAQQAWKDYAVGNVVLVTLDFPRDKSIVPEKYVARNGELKKQFGVRGYPTYIILDSDGVTQIGKLGAGRDKTPESFIAEFKSATRLSAANIEAYVKANPDKAEAYKAAIQKVGDSKKALTDWLATKPKRNEENNQLFTNLRSEVMAAEEELNKF